MQDSESLEYQDQLLRGLTHKMNNILSLFHGYLGLLLEDEKLDANTLSGLNRIREGAFTASGLMDRLQSMVRPSTLKLREVNLGEVLGSCQKGFEELATRGVRITVSCQDNLPPIFADPARIRTVLSEIVSNAIEASPDQDEVRIEAGIDMASAQHSNSIRTSPWVLISVKNSGNEIPPSVLKRIFEPFFTTRQSRSAFGLGLPVAQALARQLGGSLTFEHTAEATVCSVRLPLHKS